LKGFDRSSIDSCITDPPYGMGMDKWDYSVPSVEIWGEVFLVLKPGAFCLSFCSPQLYHRLVCNIEDAGFIIHDQIMWMITTKMPKTNRLKPAHEPIVVAQKPYQGSLRSNFNKWGVGIIDIENARIPWEKKPPTGWVAHGGRRRTFGKDGKTRGSIEEFGRTGADPRGRYSSNVIGEVLPQHQKYFYAPRVSRKERGKYNDHPTPKPLDLMEYLIKIYCPLGGTVLDPFFGSGTTGLAALNTGRLFIGIEISERYVEIAKKRIGGKV
jgi:site-specific DNA-methyltransferase (adenine-specific)